MIASDFFHILKMVSLGTHLRHMENRGLWIYSPFIPIYCLYIPLRPAELSHLHDLLLSQGMAGPIPGG
jgi:hypothetical protein